MKISELRNLCFEYELKDREVLSQFTNDELEQFYNGAGPDSWKPEYRKKLTTAMSLFEPVVLIHDTQFFMSDGSEEGFKRTVDVWKENCKIIFNKKYPFWTVKIFSSKYRRERLYWRGVMHATMIAIATNSAKDAWNAAYKKRQNV